MQNIQLLSQWIAKQMPSLKLGKRPNRLGFTLIELLVVITIIGILMSLITVAVLPIQRKGRDSKRKADMNLFLSGANLFKADFKIYPNTTFYLGDNTALDPGAANSNFNLAADLVSCNSLTNGKTNKFATAPANGENPSIIDLNQSTLQPGFLATNHFLVCLKYVDRILADPNQAGSLGYQYRVSYDYSDAIVTASLENQADPDLVKLFNQDIPSRYYQGSGKNIRHLDDDSDAYNAGDQYTGTFYTTFSSPNYANLIKDGRYLYQCLKNADGTTMAKDNRSLSANDPLPFNASTGKWTKNSTNCQDPAPALAAQALDVLPAY